MRRPTFPCILHFGDLLLAVTICRENLLLSKNRLATADELFEFSETAVSSCDDSEQFDDGTDRDSIKCTTARERLGVWSHDEYSCRGMQICIHNLTVILLIINYTLILYLSYTERQFIH